MRPSASRIACLFLVLGACGGSSRNDARDAEDGQGGQSGDGGDGAGDEPAGPMTECERAAANHSYVGCDYWPNALANDVDGVYDFAVVVANASDEAAAIEVTGGALAAAVTETVAPKALRTLYLPWVPELKTRPDSRVVAGGAYHLVSSRPVTVYQFNPIEYKATGGPPGKDWGRCAGDPGYGDCYSFSNDASLLIPSTAMTGNYRVTGHPGDEMTAPYFAITATRDDTRVKVTMGKNAPVHGGLGVPDTEAGETFEVTLLAGDVMHVATFATPHPRAPLPPPGPLYDMSGSLVVADKPVQVIAGIPCTFIPREEPFCDHIEETVMPTETLGRRYFVNAPTDPAGKPTKHIVRIYAAHDGTTFTYAPAKPAGAPDKLDDGGFADLGIVSDDFEVNGSKEFAVGTFQLGSQLVSMGVNNAPGDPAQSQFVAVEQYRAGYIFLTPVNYQTAFGDIVAPAGTAITIDGKPVTATPHPIGATGYDVIRIPLDLTGDGAHNLEASKPVGLQVIGYGSFTSYQYPGGMNLKRIGTASGP